MRLRAVVAAALTLTLALVTVPVRGSDTIDGALHRLDLERFRSVGSIESPESAGEFGTDVRDQFIATAPGAEGGGRVFFVSDEEVIASLSAADLDGPRVSRFGEGWGDLGHPPGTESALVFGAPGEPKGRRSAARGAIRPAAIIVEYTTTAVGNSFVGEVRRVTGKRNSMFGWRVVATDSQFPEASFNGAFIVSAPHENRGKERQRAGAVYKFDTETGQRLWRFRSKGGGEMAGYSLRVIPDLDGDDFSELLVGAPGSGDLEVPGRVYVLSGRTGKVLEQIEAPEGAVLFGYALHYGSSLAAIPGLLVSAPLTPKGRKDGVGAIYAYADLDKLRAEPEVFRGRRRDQWFGVSLVQSPTHLLVGSFERHRKANKDGRGSVTAMLSGGKVAKTIRGKTAGEYFGRSLAVGQVLAVGAPGALPLIVPE